MQAAGCSFHAQAHVVLVKRSGMTGSPAHPAGCSVLGRGASCRAPLRVSLCACTFWLPEAVTASMNIHACCMWCLNASDVHVSAALARGGHGTTPSRQNSAAPNPGDHLATREGVKTCHRTRPEHEVWQPRCYRGQAASMIWIIYVCRLAQIEPSA